MRKTFFSLIAVLVFLLSHNVLAQEARPTESLLQEAPSSSTISPEESEERLKDAKMLFDRGKTDAAIYMLQQLEKADPTNYKVLFKLGEMAIADRNWAYSISVLRKASFIRPEDIEVRLILIDIYKAYQMPIQGIIVAKEILVLDPQHLIGATRLAELFKEQAMLEDEIKARQKVRHLKPDEYENLARLASIYYESGDLWEAAKIYEEIRMFYPKKNKDLSRLVAIYDKLGESFRGLEVIDHLAKNGERRRWLKKRAVKNLRKQSSLYDPFLSTLTFRQEKSEELKETSIVSESKYIHLSLSSSVDFGLKVKLESISNSGLNDLADEFDIDIDINSASIVLDVVKNWEGQNYQLVTSLGVLVDDVSGSIVRRSIVSRFTVDDFPFFKDPSFNSYGGELPIGGLKFIAQPGLHRRYQIIYEHGLVTDLDARLNLIYFDKVTADFSYLANDLTALQFAADGSAVSDGNERVHGLASASYLLWGSDPVHDYRGKRKSFFRYPPANHLMTAYTIEYFTDQDQSNLYETFSGEIRHKGQLLAQLQLARVGNDRFFFLNIGYAYKQGKTLDSQHNGEARVFYYDSNSENEIGLSFTYEQSEVEDATQPNQRIVGKSDGYGVTANVKWRF